MMTTSNAPYWCTSGVERILKRHKSVDVKEFYQKHNRAHDHAIRTSGDPVRELDKMYTETASIIAETLMCAAKKMGGCDIKASSALGRGKKLKQRMRERNLGAAQNRIAANDVQLPLSVGPDCSSGVFESSGLLGSQKR